MRMLYFSKHLALTCIGLAAIFATNVQAVEQIKPQVDTSALPALGWHEPNPLRGNTQAIVIGQTAFNQSCAKCHGDNANGARSPAPTIGLVTISMSGMPARL